ncbi:hypothetical protein [Pseudomonas capeferrum]|uniref:hypothetical protein n=1 Tax=Pseudomonas capeferrum TaxID=1495066 RepID=UPI002158A831|nr:hypothetical protein [Pseudomonas capeferrum]
MAMHMDLQIYKASLGLLQMATNLTRNIPRDLKQSLGKRVIDECIDVLMLIARANSTQDKATTPDLLERKASCAPSTAVAGL